MDPESLAAATTVQKKWLSIIKSDKILRQRIRHWIKGRYGVQYRCVKRDAWNTEQRIFCEIDGNSRVSRPVKSTASKFSFLIKSQKRKIELSEENTSKRFKSSTRLNIRFR